MDPLFDSVPDLDPTAGDDPKVLVLTNSQILIYLYGKIYNMIWSHFVDNPIPIEIHNDMSQYHVDTSI